MIKSSKDKNLRDLFLAGESSKIDPSLQQRLIRRLDVLNKVIELQALNVPGFNFHGLQGNPKRFSIHVNGPWCLTFEWRGPDAYLVDFEQYHSRTKTMTQEYTVDKQPTRPPTHPGAVIREDVLPALKISVTEAAKQLHISRQAFHKILAEKTAVNPDMALKLAKFCGNTPSLECVATPVL
jgi:toxin HigB-1